jgi:signal transduction histidine kinase/CheY-like chemotaxis protein
MSVQKFSRRPIRHFPLRTVLIVPFILQIVGAVGLVGYLSFKNGQKAVNEVADQLLNEITARVDQNLRNYLTLPHKVNQNNAILLHLGQLNLKDLPGLERYFWQQLQVFNELTFVGLGLENKNNLGAERFDDGTLTIRVSTQASHHIFQTFATDAAGNRQTLIKSIPFDPRTRPWYKAAVAKKGSVWSDIYPNTAGITSYLGASMPFYDSNDRLLGVLLTNINLSQIGNFLENLKIGKSGQIFIVDKSGMLVATSTGEKPFRTLQKAYGAEQVAATAAQNPLTQKTAQYLANRNLLQNLGTSRQSFEVEIDDQQQFIQIQSFRDEFGLDWAIVVVVPKSDFMAQINANTRLTIALCFAALLITTVVGILTARWVVRPILNLNISAKAIAQGEWEIVGTNGSAPLQYRTDEVGELAQSFNIMAERLQESFATLEQRVAERTTELADSNQQLEVAKEKAEVANQVKSTFIANMSHELRSPLNAILGFAQLMTRSQSLSPEHRDSVGIISRSGEHLLTLINNILDLSKIEAGRTTLNPKNFDLYRLLEDIREMFQLKAEEKGLQLLVEYADNLPRYVRTDAVKLRQVLINLMNNALKFTQQGGATLRVSVLGEKVEGKEETGRWGNGEMGRIPLGTPHWATQMLHFEVEDTGAGIAPEEMDSLFEAFVQTETGKQAQEGTGLGLPISRQFVKLMGGEIRVTSEVGEGTTFAFEIAGVLVDAAEMTDTQTKRRVIALEPGQRRYRILIVDDKPLNRQLLVKLLAPLGFELREAHNGKEAIEVWQAFEPHLIWMDMRMPVMDGYEATKQIKSSTKGQATAIIALTASVLEEEREIVLSAGCDDFMRKPFQEAEIFETMYKHIGVRYIYDDSGEGNGSGSSPVDLQQALAPENLATLPIELLQQLEEAANFADFAKIDQLISEIRTGNATIASALSTLADEFAYDKIAESLKAAIDR